MSAGVIWSMMHITSLLLLVALCFTKPLELVEVIEAESVTELCLLLAY